MATTNSIEFILRARDEASKSVDALAAKIAAIGGSGKELPALEGGFKGVRSELDKVTQSSDLTAHSTTRLIRAIRELTTPLLTGLSPALGQTQMQMAGVGIGASHLSTGLIGLGVAGAGLAGILAGQLLAAWRKQSEALAEYRELSRSVDFDFIAQGAAKQRLELTKLTDAMDDLVARRKQFATTQEGGESLDPLTGLPVAMGTGAKDRALREAIERTQGLGIRLAARARGQEVSDAARAENEIPQGSTEPAAGARQADTARIKNLQRQVLEAGVFDPIERAFQAAIREADTALASAVGPEGQGIRDQMVKLASATRAEALRKRRIEFLKADAPSYDEAPGYAPYDAEAGQKISDKIVSDRLAQQRDQQMAAAAQAGDEALAHAISQKDLDTVALQLAERKLVAAKSLLDVEMQTGALRAQAPGLSMAEKDAIDLQVSALREALQIQQLSLDLRKDATQEEKNLIGARQQLVRDTETLARAQIAAQQRERVDPAAGLDKLGRELQDRADALGTAAYNMGRSASDAFSSGMGRFLGDLVTGEARKGADYGKELGNALARGILNELSSVLVGQIGATLRNALRGSPLSDLLGPSSATSGPAIGLVADGIAPGSLVNTPTGLGVVQDDGTVRLASAMQQTQRAAASAGASSSFTPAEMGATPEVFVGAANQFAAAPAPTFGLRQGAGLAVQGAGLAASLYAAYGANSTLGRAVTVGASALQGAALGAQAASYLGASDTTGAVAGALIAAAAAIGLQVASSAAQERLDRKVRQDQERQVNLAAGQALVQAANSAQSVQEFFEVLRTYQSGTFGGTASPAVVTQVQVGDSLKPVGIGAGSAGLDDLLANMNTLTASLQTNPPEPAANQATSDALKARLGQLVDQLNQGLGRAQVFTDQQTGSGITRRLAVPGTNVEALAGQDLNVETSSIADLPDDQLAILMMRMKRVNADNDIGFATTDPANGMIVSVSTVGLGGSSAMVGDRTINLAPVGGAAQAEAANGGLPPGFKRAGQDVVIQTFAQKAMDAASKIPPYQGPAWNAPSGYAGPYGPDSQEAKMFNAAKKDEYYQQQFRSSVGNAAADTLGQLNPAQVDQLVASGSLDAAAVAQLRSLGFLKSGPTAPGGPFALPSPGQTGPGAVGAPAGQSFSEGALSGLSGGLLGTPTSQAITILGTIAQVALGMPISPTAGIGFVVGLEGLVQGVLTNSVTAQNIAVQIGLLAGVRGNTNPALAAQRAGERGQTLRSGGDDPNDPDNPDINSNPDVGLVAGNTAMGQIAASINAIVEAANGIVAAGNGGLGMGGPNGLGTAAPSGITADVGVGPGAASNAGGDSVNA